MVLHTSTRLPARSAAAPPWRHSAGRASIQSAGRDRVRSDVGSVQLADLDVDDIRDRVFRATLILLDDIERIPLKTVHLNRPVLAPASALAGVDLDRIALDPVRCQRHVEQLGEYRGLLAKLALVFANERDFAGNDAEADLYGGLPPESDLALLPKIPVARPSRNSPASTPGCAIRAIANCCLHRARHHLDTLDADETTRFQSWCAPA